MCCNFLTHEEKSAIMLTESVFSSFLGPNKSLKFIVDNDQIHLISCVLPLYQIVSFNNPFANIIEETLYAHHEQFGFGATSLLAMRYFWTREFQDLIEKENMKIRDVIDTSQKTMEFLISRLSSLKISTEKLMLSVQRDLNNYVQNRRKKESKRNILGPNHKTNPTQNTSMNLQSLKFRSRHFSNFSSDEDDSSTLNDKLNPLPTFCFSELSLEELHSFAQKVGHNDPEMATLLTKIWKQQIEKTFSLRFCADNLNIICSTGVKSMTLLDGVLLKVESDDVKFIEEKKAVRLLLVNGDITLNFMHLGFSPTVTVNTMKTIEEMGKTKYNSWIKDCTSLLSNLQVSIILVKGSSDSNIENFCRMQSILLINHVPWKILSSLSKSLNIDVVTYLLDADEENISSNVLAKMWSILQDSFLHLSPLSQQIDVLQTIVFSHPCFPIVKLWEHQFYHSVFRLSEALRENVILPGSGLTERWCNEILTVYAENANSDHEREIILKIANGFNSFYEAIHQNIHLTHNNGEVFDNLTAKIEMWRSALMLCFFSLQADIQVINGSSIITKNISELHLGTL